MTAGYQQMDIQDILKWHTALDSPQPPEVDMAVDSPDRYEEFERTLDPHRAEEQRAAAAQVSARLRDRGIGVSSDESPEALADLLDAVERFEAAVKTHGGDLNVDRINSAKPDDAHFVLPQRQHREAVRAYIGRIDDATIRVQRHPRHPD